MPQRKTRGSPDGTKPFDRINNKYVYLIKQCLRVHSYGKHANNMKVYLVKYM